MNYQCAECGKPYKSKSGLRRHIKKEHPIQQAGDEMLKQAMKDLGIKSKDVLSYRVYHAENKVAIIEGPVGAKRVWCSEGE
jgi:hypothetical protein